jgi:23S rRNA (uracil1939-C5)-methyltransferase
VILENIQIDRAGGRGVAVGKTSDGKTVLVRGAAPGDVVDVRVIKRHKNFFEGRVDRVVTASALRVAPSCAHTESCGGCPWQHLGYPSQAEFKASEVEEQLVRVGGVSRDGVVWNPFISAPVPFRYRNKTEFSFTFNRWKTRGEMDANPDSEHEPGLGFHVPGFWDKILDVQDCHLIPDYGNEIRNALRDEAIALGLSFWQPRAKVGALRTAMLRSNQSGDWMLIIQWGEHPGADGFTLMHRMAERFDRLVSLYWGLNEKVNDSMYDVDLHLFHGIEALEETMESAIEGGRALKFLISPKSFYQTNPQQAHRLYSEALRAAGLKGGETVYDLYTGTGTIALFMAQVAGKVVGVESVREAVDAAFRNAERNGISNATFEAGDMRRIFTPEFVERHGQPDVIVVDPPREGMHPAVVSELARIAAPKLVYVSCNPSTQARDIQMLSEAYEVVSVQGVDMFPQTFHVESVVLLHAKSPENH